jgi:hypothetical protein
LDVLDAISNLKIRVLD